MLPELVAAAPLEVAFVACDSEGLGFEWVLEAAVQAAAIAAAARGEEEGRGMAHWERAKGM